MPSLSYMFRGQQRGILASCLGIPLVVYPLSRSVLLMVLSIFFVDYLLLSFDEVTRRQLVGDGLWGDYSGVVCCVLFYCIFYNFFCALPLWDHMEHISMLSTLLPACSFIFSVHPVRVEDPPSTIFNTPCNGMVWFAAPLRQPTQNRRRPYPGSFARCGHGFVGLGA